MKSAGFSLVELMVTVTLVAILALAAIPLTESWVKSAQVEKDSAVIRTALAQLKATAMRNPGGKKDDEIAALVCRSGTNLNVYSAKVGQIATCSNVADTLVHVWTGVMGEGVILKYPTDKELCSVRANHKGVLKFSAKDGSSCAAAWDNTVPLAMAISKGETNAPYDGGTIDVF